MAQIRRIGPAHRARAAALRFRDNTRGGIAIEFVIMIPIVFWAFMALYVFFEGYRQSAINLKAAYTVSDILSRETGQVDDTYIDSMQSLFQFLTRTGAQTAMRVSVLRWSEGDNRYYVDWSTIRDWDNQVALTDGTVSDLADRLPAMSNAERLILVETRNLYTPVFKVGLGTKELENFVFTRPRFAPQVVWSG